MNKALNIKNISLLVVFAVIAGLLLFWVWGSFQSKTTSHSDIAYMPNIETLTQSSAVIVKGKIVNDGEARNLRRDSENPKNEAKTVEPGTDYAVEIEEVLNGELDTSSIIQVAIGGGDYKGKSEPLQASVSKNQSYYFFLIPSSMGAPHYFGAGEPYIFENNGINIYAVSNSSDFKRVFTEDGLVQDEFLAKIEQGRLE